jgi:hypothetical protein
MKRTLCVIAGLTVIGLLTSCAPTTVSNSGDAIKLDPKHYKVEFENNHIRVLRANYGPHEKSPMHFHPANVVIALTDNSVRETTPDGKSSVGADKARTLASGPAVMHSMENLSDTEMQVLVIELKD